MEWVTISAKSTEEAVDQALDNLGVDEAEAEIEVLEEPRQGLFGRTRGSARIRARVKPKASRPKIERGRGRRRNEGKKGGSRSNQESRNSGRSEKVSADNSSSEDSKQSKSDTGNRPQKESASGGSNGGRNNTGRSGGQGRNSKGQARRTVEDSSVEDVSNHLEEFLTGLTDAFGFDPKVEILGDEEEGLVAAVHGKHGVMVGPKARTLDAIQELARVSAQRTVPSSIRIKVDVGGYREMRSEALIRFASEAADAAKGDGKERALEPMSSADRKVVHDAINGIDGVETRSAGNEPRRRVVVVPLVTESVEDDDADAADAAVETDVDSTETVD